MSTMTIIKQAEISHTDLKPAGQRAGADSGDPQLRVLSLAPEAAGRLGIWECQPGGWPVTDRADTEVAYILSGSATLTDERTGIRTEVSGGDLIVLPVGWTGRWDIAETVKKIYVIY